jgi:hypothetical protein
MNRRSIHGTLAIAALMLALSTTHASAQSRPRHTHAPPEPTEGATAGTHLGGPGSLPFGGAVSRAEILTAALALTPTQVALQGFVEAGYQRRADLDFVSNNLSGATVTLAHQIPGRPVEEIEPFIVVLTREGADRYFTQVFAMTLRREASGAVVQDTIVPASTFYIEPVADSGPIVPETPGRMSVPYSAAYDMTWGTVPSPQTLEFMRRSSHCWMESMRVLMEDVSISTFFGAAAGAPIGLGHATYGVVFGAAAAATRWYIRPPTIPGC